MLNYPKKEGKHGPIYQIADGLSVTPNECGSWALILSEVLIGRKNRLVKPKRTGSGP